jgi:hypothetical protein
LGLVHFSFLCLRIRRFFLTLFAVWTGQVHLDPTAQSYFQARPPSHYLVSVLIELALGVGVLQLFLLKKQALNWLSGALAASVIHSLWGMFHENLLQVASLINIVLTWAYWLLVCRYASRLTDRRVLC